MLHISLVFGIDKEGFRDREKILFERMAFFLCMSGQRSFTEGGPRLAIHLDRPVSGKLENLLGIPKTGSYLYVSLIKLHLEPTEVVRYLDPNYAYS